MYKNTLKVHEIQTSNFFRVIELNVRSSRRKLFLFPMFKKWKRWSKVQNSATMRLLIFARLDHLDKVISCIFWQLFGKSFTIFCSLNAYPSIHRFFDWDESSRALPKRLQVWICRAPFLHQQELLLLFLIQKTLQIWGSSSVFSTVSSSGSEALSYFLCLLLSAEKMQLKGPNKLIWVLPENLSLWRKLHISVKDAKN